MVEHDDRAATQPLIPVFISVILKFPLFSAFLSDPLVEQLDNSRAHTLVEDGFIALSEVICSNPNLEDLKNKLKKPLFYSCKMNPLKSVKKDTIGFHVSGGKTKQKTCSSL